MVNLSEHEASGRESGNTSHVDMYIPTEKEKKALDLVNSLFSEAKSHRAKYDYKWLDNYKFFRGKQWTEERPAYKHSEVINFVFQQIQSSVPSLTDRQPKIAFLPVEPGDRAVVKIFNQMIDYDWKRNNWFMPLVETLYDAHIYGTGYAEMGGSTKNAIGKIEYDSADPFYCFPDPMAQDVCKKSEYFIYARPLSIRRAKKKYPKIKQYIKPDLIDLVGGDKTELGKARYQSPTDKYSSVESTGQSFEDSKGNNVLEMTLYLRDSQSHKVKNEETGETVKKLKYPKGRQIVVVGGVIASDGEYEYEENNRDRFAPFAKIQNYVLPREFFGISEIEQIESPQRIFNKLISFTLDVLTLMGNPVWIIDTSSGVDPDSLINRPGLVIEKEKNSEVYRQEGTQLQPYVIQMIDRMQNWFNDVSGQTDVSAGAVPSGVTSGRAISAVQEAAKTRLRLKGRLIDLFIQDLGQMYAARVFQFYKAPRIFRITKEEGTFDFFKVNIEENPENGNKVVRLRNILEGDQGEQLDGEEQIYETSGEFDIMATVGSGLPFSQFERAEKAYQLFDRQVIDAEELLTAIEYPNKELVLERMAEKQEAQAQAQAQAGGLPTQGAPPIG